MSDLMTAQAEARKFLDESKKYSVQAVNRFSGKWITQSQTGDYMQARYDRTQLRKVHGNKKVRIIWTVTGELAD